MALHSSAKSQDFSQSTAETTSRAPSLLELLSLYPAHLLLTTGLSSKLHLSSTPSSAKDLLLPQLASSREQQATHLNPKSFLYSIHQESRDDGKVRGKCVTWMTFRVFPHPRAGTFKLQGQNTESSSAACLAPPAPSHEAKCNYAQQLTLDVPLPPHC